VRFGGQAGPSGIRQFSGWESIEHADSDTHAIGQSVSERVWESFAKSHRCGTPVPHVTLVPVVAISGFLNQVGSCRLYESWRKNECLEHSPGMLLQPLLTAAPE
jgi:hypothetical protein